MRFDSIPQAVTGFAFDLLADRTRTSFDVDPEKYTATESFEIKLRNHKREPVEIRVLERVGRWPTWEVSSKSDPFTKKDAHTIEFNIPVKPERSESCLSRCSTRSFPFGTIRNSSRA